MPPEVSTSNTRPRVGLALSGGAARGAAHVGVLRVLEEHNVPVDCIAGTSAGSLVGGAYAAGFPLDDLEEFALRMRWRDFGRVTLSRRGVQSNARLEEFIRARFPVARFEDLRIPFAAVAADLKTGAAVVLKDEGDLGFAIRASCAVPGWYVPVVDGEGRQLVDGGIVANLPVRALRKFQPPPDVLVGVDVNFEGAKFLGPPRTALGILFQTIMVVQRAISAHEQRAADVVIVPRVGHIRWDEVGRGEELIRLGREAALEAVGRIKELLEAPAGAAAPHAPRPASPARRTEGSDAHASPAEAAPGPHATGADHGRAAPAPRRPARGEVEP
jgi:NTE family protein